MGSGGGNLFSMSMDKKKVWDEVDLLCWEGCSTEYDSNVKGPGLDELGIEFFGVGLKASLSFLDLNIHVSHESTKDTSKTDATSIGFTLGDDDPGDEFVVDVYFDDKFGTMIFDTTAGRSKCPHEANT